MNIGIFDATPFWSGGSNRVFVLAKELKNKNHNVIVCCLPGSEISKRCKQEKIVFELINPLFDINPFALIEILKIISHYDIQIIDINSPKFYWLCSIAAKLKKIKVIITRNVPYRKKGIKKIINKLLYNYLTDKIVTVSQKIKKELILDFNIQEEKINVIYDGIEFPDMNEIEKTDIKFLDNKQNIHFIGVVSRLDKNKGLEYFIDCIPLVLKKMSNIKFIIVGTGKIEQKLKEKVKKYNISDKVIFTGFFHEKEKYKILSCLDITVVPSGEEGISRSALESMMFSKPVVATFTSSISEIIENGVNGILVKPYSSQELAEGIFNLLNSDYKQMGIQARKVIEEKFLLYSFVSGYEQLYKNLLTVL